MNTLQPVSIDAANIKKQIMSLNYKNLFDHYNKKFNQPLFVWFCDRITNSIQTAELTVNKQSIARYLLCLCDALFLANDNDK